MITTTLLLSLAVTPQLPGPDIPLTEFQARRNAIMERLDGGMLLIQARPDPKAESQPAFIQNASFYYFTGLANQPGAILVLDGSSGEARLFVPPPPRSFGLPVDGLVLAPGDATARAHGMDAVQPWREFVPHVRGRLADGVTTIHLDGSRRPEPASAPDGMLATAGSHTVWRQSVTNAFPGARIASARDAIQTLRWTKSTGEIDRLRRNARATAAALLAGMRRIRPGVTHRRVEAAVVAECIEAGAQGPSFWPWTMAGPNAHVGQLVKAFYLYEHLNRPMGAGELVRVDIGCTGEGYGGDVGRTVPVSGVFSSGQREIWNLLIAAYRAGLAAIRPGVATLDVMAASRTEIARHQGALVTGEGRRAAAVLLGDNGLALWGIHGVGIESGEAALSVLQEGSVIAFEPMFSVDGDAYYLEDMIAVTADGHEVLSAGLPYTAGEIEAAMRR